MRPDELEAALRALGAERYHWNHPVPPRDEGRRADQGAGPGLGAQPLLLSGADPDQGRDHPRPDGGSRDAPRLAPADHRPRRRARRRRRHRALAQADRRARARARLRGLDRRPAAGDPLRGRGLRPLRARALAARGDRVVADRDVRAHDHRRPGLGHARELRLRQPRDAGLLRQAPDPGAARCRFRARPRQARRRGGRRSSRRCSAALRFKCDMLWAQLDALEHAYAVPGRIPPGAFRPERG